MYQETAIQFYPVANGWCVQLPYVHSAMIDPDFELKRQAKVQAVVAKKEFGMTDDVLENIRGEQDNYENVPIVLNPDYFENNRQQNIWIFSNPEEAIEFIRQRTCKK